METLELSRNLPLLLLVIYLSFVSSLDNATTTSATVNETSVGSTEETGHIDKCESTEETFSSEVHIAKFEFERVQTLFIVTLFILVVVLAKLGKMIHWYMD